MKRAHLLAVAAGAALIAAGLFSVYYAQPPQNTAFAMDTVISADIRGLSRGKTKKLLKESFALCDKYERELSRTVPGNPVNRLNNGETVAVSAETLALLEKGVEYSRLSGGAFDITIMPLVALWDVRITQTQAPPEAEIRRAREMVCYGNIVMDGGEVSLRGGAKIDLGGIAKGYIGDRMKEYLISQGCESAIINLGGNVVTIGARDDGKPWAIGVQKPFANQGETAAILRVKDKSVVTSGRYERYFMTGGTVYHHILDPKTGRPAENELDSVTIVHDLSADADALSTACFVLGPEAGMELLNSLPGAEGLFILRSGEIVTTPGMEAYMEPAE